MSSSTSSIQPAQASQASQASSTSSLGPMQAYGPINIPPGTMIRRVQNLPAGAVPIDPSMIPPGMIPLHAKANPNASQGMPRPESAEHGKPRRISDDSGDERFVRRMRPSSTSDSDSDSTSDSDEKEVESAKPSNVATRAAAVAATGQQQISSQAKRQTSANLPPKHKQQQQQQQQQQQSRGGRRGSRRRRGGSSLASPQSVPLKTEPTPKPELIEPLQRAMSSEFIPVEDNSKLRSNSASSSNNNSQAKANPKGFSIMDDGWGV